MLFNSPQFIVFYACVFALYWSVRQRVAQNVVLLAASLVFYGAWSWLFLALLLATTIVDFVCGLAIDDAAGKRAKRTVLIASLAFNLAVLGTFKYAGFFVEEFAQLLNALGFRASIPVLQIVLPIGISFYTFQSMAYVIDVYRGKHHATRSLLDYALYVAFFPQLVAGPIERAAHMLPQFERPRAWSRVAFESGLMLMIWGLFKKVVIADNLSPYVDAVYADPSRFSGPTVLTATLFFAFQIYCDFSGYSDTARGVARTLGFDLVKNFDYPYFTRNPVDFWRRWHISLSQWFQDYLYFPLAMSYMRKGGWGSRYKAHIISMLLIGFWHGANWTFILFGLYWGIVIASYLALVERSARRAPAGRIRERTRRDDGIHAALSVIAMFAVTCGGWILFRAATLGDAAAIWKSFGSLTGEPVPLEVDALRAPVLWLMIAALWLGEWIARNRPMVTEAFRTGAIGGYLARYAMLVGILFSYVAYQGATERPFIYFQF